VNKNPIELAANTKNDLGCDSRIREMASGVSCGGSFTPLSLLRMLAGSNFENATNLSYKTTSIAQEFQGVAKSFHFNGMNYRLGWFGED
jgi:hypothetical protein